VQHAIQSSPEINDDDDDDDDDDDVHCIDSRSNITEKESMCVLVDRKNRRNRRRCHHT